MPEVDYTRQRKKNEMTKPNVIDLNFDFFEFWSFED